MGAPAAMVPVVPVSGTAAVATTGSRLAEWFLQLISDLAEHGYFDHALPRGCEDAGDEDLVDPSLVLVERIGVPDL